MSKRPWKKVATLTRNERNNGDVFFEAVIPYHSDPMERMKEFQNLTDAETHLNTWHAAWWPLQIKHTRKA